MITDEEVKGLIRKFIVKSDTLKSINGKVITTTRPDNSGKEDVVISILDNHNDELQPITVNINVYVQDINPNGYYEEDGLRLKELSKICETLFNKRSIDLLQFYEFQQRTFKNEASNEHFVNNKLIYKFYNE